MMRLHNAIGSLHNLFATKTIPSPICINVCLKPSWSVGQTKDVLEFEARKKYLKAECSRN